MNTIINSLNLSTTALNSVRLNSIGQGGGGKPSPSPTPTNALRDANGEILTDSNGINLTYKI